MPTDPHQGGSLTDMAVNGTTVPGDAGKMNTIPSVPRPGQTTEQSELNPIGAADQHSAVDNPTDIPRSGKDMGATGGVITGTGDQLPATIESKRMHFSPNDAKSKGHDRYDKHSQDKQGLDKFAGSGATVQPAPGEEGDSQDAIRDRKGL
ncbi:hypothetical protein K490DRAFT_51381 [Saccharata proteae CBS 121410]|uniref:Uncharacterized protein n=1 Tax=Saccharata proteae CBS 121410 TaxID=1314787 RepID=A0A9P4HMZ8_9PEZI|nr:hypothetical protein K490DRAFT_51381 [Saccharata proteae CBS 121410]